MTPANQRKAAEESNMTDRKLLEAAAKAAGYAVDRWVEGYDDYYWHGSTWGLHINGSDVPVWNPLEDDGDAFRLAVQLRLKVETFESSSFATWQDEWDWYPVEVKHAGDARSATRLAIVRAAAQMAGHDA